MATRATIRSYARLRADQNSSDFPADADYNLIIDAQAKKMWFALYGAGFPIDFSSKTITANGATTYPLGVGNVAFVVGVYFLQGTDCYELRRLNEGKRAALRSWAGQTNYAEFYDLRVNPTSGVVIELAPKPTSGTYQVDYVLEYPGFAGDSDVWYGPARSEEVISLWAAAEGCLKEGQGRAGDAKALFDEGNALMDQVLRQASWIDARNPAQVRDVSGRSNRLTFDYPAAGPEIG